MLGGKWATGVSLLHRGETSAGGGKLKRLLLSLGRVVDQVCSQWTDGCFWVGVSRC